MSWSAFWLWLKGMYVGIATVLWAVSKRNELLDEARENPIEAVRKMRRRKNWAIRSVFGASRGTTEQKTDHCATCDAAIRPGRPGRLCRRCRGCTD